MGKLSKKANVKFAPSVIPVPSSKPAKKGKRNAEAALKKPVSAKRPKKEIQKVQRKQRDEKKLSKAPQPKKQLETSSSEDTSSESEEEVKITLKKGAKQPVKQEAMESSSSEDSSSDEESKLPRAAVSSKGLQNTGIKDNKFVSSKKDDSIDSSEFDSSSESDDSSSEFDSSSESNESSDSSEFDSSESDEENVTKTIAPSKKPTSVALPMKKSESSDSSDSDSDEDEEVAAKVSATTKRVSAAPKKKVESTSSSESDSDSDEEDSCAIPTLEQLANNLEVIKKNTTDAIAKLYREFNTEHEKRKRLHTHIDQVEKDFSFDHSLILEHTKKYNNMDARVTANFDANNREISQLKEKMNYLNTQLLHQNQIQASVPPTQPNTQDGFSAATPHPNMILVNRDVHYNMFNDGYEQALIKAARMGLLREESLQAPTLVSHGFNRLSELMQAFYFVEKTYSRRKYRKGSLEN